MAIFRLFILLLAVAFIGTQCNDCPDATNPDCDNYDPCYPNLCEDKGSVEVHTVFSAGLENNLLGDSPERKVSVYLPAGYEEDAQKRYPVIYLLHGYASEHTSWFGGIESGGYKFYVDIKKALDSLILEEFIKPVIVVAPDSYNRYLGSKYANSSTSGNWEDFIVKDVVQYTDAHFRTLAVRESRGIAGVSMGGHGAMKFAMKHSDLFSAVYSVSGASLVFKQDYLITEREDMIKASQEKTFSLFAGLGVLSKIACAPAFAPNPASHPFYGDFPLTENGDLVDSTWQRWLQHDPFTLLPSHKDNLMQLTAIQFDCGTSDKFAVSNSLFSDALTEHGIEHTYKPYEGDHFNKIDQRMRSEVFPFFSRHLEH